MQLPGNYSTNGSADAEYISLHLPSHLGRDWCDGNAAEALAKAEIHLREGQLNDSLHHIRIALGHKSYLFRQDVRPACTQRLKTRAWAEVHCYIPAKTSTATGDNLCECSCNDLLTAGYLHVQGKR